MRNGQLSGKNVLLVEDEFLIAAGLAQALEDLGAVVLGPAPTIAAAHEILAEESRIDAGILDVSVRNETVFPIAAALQERNVPFVFATGYDRPDLPARFAGVPCCEKPVELARLVQALTR
jgi:CheY-like chemotaxis protein